VNESFVSKYLHSENPLGQRVKLGLLETLADPVREPWFEIVGVVGDVRNRGLQAPVEAEVWVPYTVTGSGAQALMVRSRQTPMALMNEVRQAVWATDAGVALAFPSALEDRISQQLYAGPRFGFLLMMIFGCLGLILVTVGVYSVLAYATARKTHEIGIRMALGAERADVLGLMIKAGLRLVGAGVAVGLFASLLLGRAIEAELALGRETLRSADIGGHDLVAGGNRCIGVLDSGEKSSASGPDGGVALRIGAQIVDWEGKQRAESGGEVWEWIRCQAYGSRTCSLQHSGGPCRI